MSTSALATRQTPLAGLVLAQAAWDNFFTDALAEFQHPNPNLCQDLALDKTIRALGHRPRAPLTIEERADLEIRADVAKLIAASARPSGFRHCDRFEQDADPDASTDYLEGNYELEDLCDNAIEGE